MKRQGTNMWSEGIVEDGIKPFLISTMRFWGGPNSIYLSIPLSIHVIYTYTQMYIGIWHQVFIIIYYVHDIPANMHISNKYMYIATAYSFLNPPLCSGNFHGGYPFAIYQPFQEFQGGMGSMPVLHRSLSNAPEMGLSDLRKLPTWPSPRWQAVNSGGFLGIKKSEIWYPTHFSGALKKCTNFTWGRGPTQQL